MGEHNIYPGHTRSAAAMIRCFARLLASFSYMPPDGYFLKRIALRRPVILNLLFLPFILVPAGRDTYRGGAYGLPEGLRLPAGHKLYGALMAGRPDVAYVRIPFRSKPEVVTWE